MSRAPTHRGGTIWGYFQRKKQKGSTPPMMRRKRRKTRTQLESKFRKKNQFALGGLTLNSGY